MKKIKILIIITALSLPVLRCSEMQITGPDVKKELQSAADSIKKNKNYIYKLDDKVIGRKGYFYIIKSNGRILHHPKKALINYDFSSYAFIQKILKERKGCISFNTEGTRRYVFFNEINTDEILCLTVDYNEFTGPVYECDSTIEEKK